MFITGLCWNIVSERNILYKTTFPYDPQINGLYGILQLLPNQKQKLRKKGTKVEDI